MSLKQRIKNVEDEIERILSGESEGLAGVMVYDGDEAYPMHNPGDRYPLSDFREGQSYGGSHGVLLVPAPKDRDEWQRQAQAQQAASMDRMKNIDQFTDNEDADAAIDRLFNPENEQ